MDMMNIIDIYESILSTTKGKVAGAKSAVKGVTLKHLDSSDYERLFDPQILEDIIYHLMSWKAFDKDIIYKVIQQMNLHHIPLNDDVIEFYHRLINIHKEHKIVDSWMWYYKDVNSIAVADVEILQPAFKENKIYKGYTKTQEKMRERAPKYWELIDVATQYVVYYKNNYAYWFMVPNTLKGEDKMFMENLMKLMVKYNK